MPLSVLVPMILIGLPLVIGLVWFTSRNQAGVMLDPETAISRFTEDFPNAIVQKVWISDNGADAILRLTEPTHFGLVHRVGKNHLTRLVEKQDIRDMNVGSGAVELRLWDFTFAGLRFVSASEDDSIEVGQWLEKVRR
ncbi:MAG: hypothetical protein AAFN43_01320 [Pseudomonadota bacterium]